MLVFSNMRTLADGHDKIVERMDEHAIDDRLRFERMSNQITALQVKAAVLGALGGGAIGFLVSHFTQG